MQFRSIAALTAVAGLSAFTLNVFGHAEHDKPRYVLQTGKDSGDCSLPFRPCATIGYAAEQANKGDRVLVGSGTYRVTSAEEIYYLTSQLVPVTGGYEKIDNFQVQNPDANPTYLLGVPAPYRDELYKAGFTIIADGQASREETNLDLSKFDILTQSQTNAACVDGSADGFECQNIDLLAHVPLNQLSANPGGANDIWGHVDLNTNREYALLGLNRGTTVVDVTDPANPVEVGHIEGRFASWRDIKVYQYFDNALGVWQAYAYVSTDGTADGLVIIDLNNLPNAVSLANRDMQVTSAHNVYISNVDYTLGTALPGLTPTLQLPGSNLNGGASNSYSLKNPEQVTLSYTHSSATRNQDYTHDGSSMNVTDERATRDCINPINGRCDVYIDFNEDDLRLWDTTSVEDTRRLSSTSYPNASYVHSGWWSEDKQYVFLHDELDERNVGLNTTLRVFDVSDLNSPVLAGTWVSDNQTIDHNGFVRGNRYYMSNYERGLTILDISDPTNPELVGYFDTYPVSNNPAFNGAWGVYPYLPSGNILVSDINSGLYILKDNTRNQASEPLVEFNAAIVNTAQDTSLNIDVNKQGSGTATVHWEVLTGSATSSDVTVDAGTLSWTASDENPKSITLSISAQSSSEEIAESFFVRLFNPSAGSNLGDISYVRVDIEGQTVAGNLSFLDGNETISETSGTYEVSVQRVGGVSGPVSVEVVVTGGEAVLNEDFTFDGDSTVSWADQESGEKTIQLNILDDDIAESDEQVVLALSNNSAGTISGNDEFVLTIGDNENNTLPIVNAGGDREVNTRTRTSVVGTASDEDGEIVSVAWTQTSGPAVELENADTETVSFNSGDSAGNVVLELTATDNHGATASASVTITVVEPAPVVTPTNNSGSSGGGSLPYGLLLSLTGLTLFRRKKAG